MIPIANSFGKILLIYRMILVYYEPWLEKKKKIIFKSSNQKPFKTIQISPF